MSRALAIARFCGLVPLVTGSGIFLLWLLTRWTWLMVAGIFTLYGGAVLFVAGLLALVGYAGLARSQGQLPGRTILRTALPSAILLVVNFPAAFGIILAVNSIETRYSLTVRNDASQALEQVHIWGGGAEFKVDHIAAHEVVSGSLWFNRDGDLKFEATLGGRRLSETVEGYVTNGIGGSTAVVVNPESQVRITKRAN